MISNLLIEQHIDTKFYTCTIIVAVSNVFEITRGGGVKFFCPFSGFELRVIFPQVRTSLRALFLKIFCCQLLSV